MQLLFTMLLPYKPNITAHISKIKNEMQLLFTMLLPYKPNITAHISKINNEMQLLFTMLLLNMCHQQIFHEIPHTCHLPKLLYVHQ